MEPYIVPNNQGPFVNCAFSRPQPPPNALCLLLGFLLASSLLLLLFSLLPTGVGVVFLHGSGQGVSLLAEILLVNYSVLVNNECHHAGRSVFCRIGHKSKPPGHFAVYDVTLRAA